MTLRLPNYIIFLASMFLLVLALPSCGGKGSGSESGGDKTPQGVIIYEISYPGFENSQNILVAGLPKKMRLVYKGDRYKTEVEQKLMKFKTTLISDNKKEELTAILKSNKKEYFTKMDSKEVAHFLTKFPKVEYLDDIIKDTSLNLNVEKQIALFDNISGEVHLCYTNELGIENSNWCNPFKEIKGMLLQYGFEYYGVTMNFKAVSINKKDIPDSEFDIPEGYKEVPYKSIDGEINKLFSMLN